MGEKIKILKLIDPDGKVFGIRQTDGEVHIIGKGYTGATYQSPRIDPASFSLESIDIAHSHIHSGESYVAHHYEADFDKADEIGILFTTPNTAKWIHAFPLVYCGAAALFQICEAPVLDAGEYPTTFFTPINRNRNSSNTSGVLSVRAASVVNRVSLKVVADASPVTGDGTVIHSEVMGSGKQGGGSGSRDDSEYILKQNTTYYFRLKGMTGGADNSVASMQVTWYENIDLE